MNCSCAPAQSVSGVTRSDVVMNPFIFFLTCYKLNNSFYISLGSDYSNFSFWKVLLAIFHNERS